LLGDEGNKESHPLVISMDLFNKLSKSISGQDSKSVEGAFLGRANQLPRQLVTTHAGYMVIMKQVLPSALSGLQLI
jgi:hypothetical protein